VSELVVAPKWCPCVKQIAGVLGVPSRFKWDEGKSHRRRNWAKAAGGLPGVGEGDMSKKNGQRKHGTTRGSPRRSRTAKAARISLQEGEIVLCLRVGRMGSNK